MSIYAHWCAIGEDEDFEPNGEVLSYTRSSRFPDPALDKVGAVNLSEIPPWCDPSVPEEDAEAYPPAEWLRLYVCTWNEKYERPMTSDEATVLLNESAVRTMVEQLSMWLDQRKTNDRTQ